MRTTTKMSLKEKECDGSGKMAGNFNHFKREMIYAARLSHTLHYIYLEYNK
jgi:hypothetical protein